MASLRYYKIHDWMVEGLGLEKADLLVFAYLYSYNNFYGTAYTNGTYEIASAVGYSAATVTKSLNMLLDNEHIVETGETVNGRLCIGYVVKKLPKTSRYNEPNGYEYRPYNNQERYARRGYHYDDDRYQEDYHNEVRTPGVRFTRGYDNN